MGSAAQQVAEHQRREPSALLLPGELDEGRVGHQPATGSIHRIAPAPGMRPGVYVGFKKPGSPALYFHVTEHVQAAHLAFKAASREHVAAFHRAPLDAGGRDNGAPGPRPEPWRRILRGVRVRSRRSHRRGRRRWRRLTDSRRARDARAALGRYFGAREPRQQGRSPEFPIAQIYGRAGGVHSTRHRHLDCPLRRTGPAGTTPGADGRTRTGDLRFTKAFRAVGLTRIEASLSDRDTGMRVDGRGLSRTLVMASPAAGPLFRTQFWPRC